MQNRRKLEQTESLFKKDGQSQQSTAINYCSQTFKVGFQKSHLKEKADNERSSGRKKNDPETVVTPKNN